MTNDEYMELGETGFAPMHYGFLNIITGEKLDHEGNPLKEDEETSKED